MSSNLASLASGEEVKGTQGVGQGEGGVDQVRITTMLYYHYFIIRFNVATTP
jgi:hypothetical protein